MPSSSSIEPVTKDISGNLVLSINQTNNKITTTSNVPLKITTGGENPPTVAQNIIDIDSDVGTDDIESVNSSDSTFIPFSESEEVNGSLDNNDNWEDMSSSEEYTMASEEFLTKKQEQSDFMESIGKCTSEENMLKITRNMEYVQMGIATRGPNSLLTDEAYKRIDTVINLIDEIKGSCLIKNSSTKNLDCEEIGGMLTQMDIESLKVIDKLLVKYEKILKKVVDKLIKLYDETLTECQGKETEKIILLRKIIGNVRSIVGGTSEIKTACKNCKNKDMSSSNYLPGISKKEYAENKVQNIKTLPIEDNTIMSTSEEFGITSLQESSYETIDSESSEEGTNNGTAFDSNSQDLSTDTSSTSSSASSSVSSSSSSPTLSLEARANISSITKIKNTNVQNNTNISKSTKIIVKPETSSKVIQTIENNRSNDNSSWFGTTTFFILFVVIGLLLVNYLINNASVDNVTIDQISTTSLSELSLDKAVGGSYSYNLWDSI